MNRLKPFFLTVFLLLLSALDIHMLYLLYVHGPATGIISALFSTTTVLMFFVSLYVLTVPRTSANLPWMVAITLIATVISVVNAVLDLNQLTGAIYSAITLLGTLSYIFWYSQLNREPNQQLQAGAILPEFALSKEDGTPINSKEFLGRKALLIFYRGNWCPFCMAQIKEIAEIYQSLAERGIEIAFISPQSQSHTQQLASVFDIPAYFLVDDEGAAAKALGIYTDTGLPAGLEIMGYDSDTVYPTTLIVDEERQIIFSDLTENYRVRPHPADYLRIIDQHKEKN